MAIYYHNPRCSKSREGLALLKDSALDFTLKHYLQDGFERDELKEIFSKLGKKPADVVRSNDAIFKEKDLANKNLNDEQWIDEILDNPILMERPILINNEKAIIGRPPEVLKTII